MNASAGADKPRFLTLELGRFLAALGVVLFHYTGVVADFTGQTVFGDVFRPGHVGVPYFFVLSGFIIYHVHRHDFRVPGAVRRFAIKRAVRLYPMFWAISLAMLAGFWIMPGLADARQITGPNVLRDLLLLPISDAILSISWTLRHEMLFYALFAVALWHGRWMLWLVAFWIMVSLYGAIQGADATSLGAGSTVASVLNLGFGLGLVIAIRLPHAARIPATLSLYSGAIVMVGTGFLEWWLGRYVDHATLPLGLPGEVAYLVSAALVINGLVRMEPRLTVPMPRLCAALGGSSYILYLVHQPLASVALRLAARVGGMSASLAFILLIALAVAISLALHLLVERRVIGGLSRLSRPWTGTGQGQASA